MFCTHKIFAILTIFLMAFLLQPTVTRAEDVIMSLAPSTGTFRVDDEVDFQVTVTSGNETVRAVEGTISYNPKELAIVNVFTQNSVLSSWTQKPYVDRELGLIEFGGTLSTSTKLSGSTIFTIRARGERAGNTALIIQRGTVLNISEEGIASNVLTGTKSGEKYVILPEELVDTSPPTPLAVENVATALSAGEVLGDTTESVDVPEEVPAEEAEDIVATATPVASMEPKEPIEEAPAVSLIAPPPPIADEGFLSRHPSVPFVLILFFLLMIFSVRIFRNMANERVEEELLAVEPTTPRSSAQIILTPRSRN